MKKKMLSSLKVKIKTFAIKKFVERARWKKNRELFSRRYRLRTHLHFRKITIAHATRWPIWEKEKKKRGCSPTLHEHFRNPMYFAEKRFRFSRTNRGESRASLARHYPEGTTGGGAWPRRVTARIRPANRRRAARVVLGDVRKQQQTAGR